MIMNLEFPIHLLKFISRRILVTLLVLRGILSFDANSHKTGVLIEVLISHPQTPGGASIMRQHMALHTTKYVHPTLLFVDNRYVLR